MFIQVRVSSTFVAVCLPCVAVLLRGPAPPVATVPPPGAGCLPCCPNYSSSAAASCAENSHNDESGSPGGGQ